MLGLMTFAVVACSASAQADNAGWYLGGNAGVSRSRIDDDRIASQLLSAGLTTTSIAEHERDFGYKIFGGYQINRYLALEGGYFDLGKSSFTATTRPPGTLSGDITLRGLNFDIVGILPITERFSALGRGGLNYAQARDSFQGTGAVKVTDPNPGRRAANYKFGAGLQYNLTESLGLRAEAERYRVDDAIGNKGDIDLFSVGLVYCFFGSTPAPAARASVPEPTIPGPVTPASVPPHMKVIFSADSLFDFDKSDMKPDGKVALDTFSANLRGVDFETIVITGHADRIGAHAYNMTLSM